MTNNILKINFVLLLVFCSTFLFSQKQNLKKYYKEVEQAEKCIIQEKYDKAAIHYQAAYKNKSFMFEKDLINALRNELNAKKTNIENYKNYAIQLKKYNSRFYINKNLKKKFADIDTICLDTIKIYENKYIRQSIEEMLVRDQAHREDYNYDDSIQRLLIWQDDSVNMQKFKELMQTYNVFDERYINYNKIVIFFNHWFMVFPEEQNYFLPKMLEAVYNGTLDARKYADIFDVLDWRANPKNIFNSYGTNFFIIFKERPTNSDDVCNTKEIFYAVSPYNKNDKEQRKWLKTTDKNRKKIFLNKTIESAITNFKMFI